MIQGIGIDIMEIGRFQQSIGRFGERFLTKLFTDFEIRRCHANANPAQYFTAHFSAKEALSKALATGNSGMFRWKDVEIFFLPNGRPEIRFYNALSERLKTHNVHLSLSMSHLQVVAFVVIQLPKTEE